MLIQNFSENCIKILFSTVLIQLFLIVLGAEANCFTPLSVISMLEYPAASAMCTLGGGLLLDYILKN